LDRLEEGMEETGRQIKAKELNRLEARLSLFSHLNTR